MKKTAVALKSHRTNLPPNPTGEERRVPVNFQCEERLLAAVHEEIGRHEKETFRRAAEWGLRAYLLKMNPAAAAKLGIK
jgi:hypothetical protein